MVLSREFGDSSTNQGHKGHEFLRRIRELVAIAQKTRARLANLESNPIDPEFTSQSDPHFQLLNPPQENTDRIALVTELVRSVDSLPPDSSEARAGLMIRAILDSILQNWQFLDTDELTPEMEAITIDSYERNAAYYAFEYEMNAVMVERTREDYLSIFMNQIKELVHKDGGNVFVIGSGNGRDVVQLIMEGFNVHANDVAESMLESTQAWGDGKVVTYPGDIRKINPFGKNNLHGVIAESAPEHMNKREVVELTDKVGNWLRRGGIFLLRVRRSEEGKVFEVQDGVGRRFFTTWTQTDIDWLTHEFADVFDVIDQWPVPHKEDRPEFYTVLLRKK